MSHVAQTDHGYSTPANCPRPRRVLPRRGERDRTLGVVALFAGVTSIASLVVKGGTNMTRIGGKVVIAGTMKRIIIPVLLGTALLAGCHAGAGALPAPSPPQGSPVAAQGSTSGHKVVSQVVHGPVADDVARRHRVHVRWAPHPVVMPTTHAPKPTAPQTGSSASLTTKPSMKPPTAPPTKLPTTTAPTAPTGIPPLDLGTFMWIDSEGTCSVSLPVPFDAGAQSYEFSVGDIPSSCGSADLVIKVSVKPSSSGATGFFGVGAASSDISADIPVGTVYSLAATADSTYVIKVSGDGTFDVSVSL